MVNSNKTPITKDTWRLQRLGPTEGERHLLPAMASWSVMTGSRDSHKQTTVMKRIPSPRFLVFLDQMVDHCYM